MFSSGNAIPFKWCKLCKGLDCPVVGSRNQLNMRQFAHQLVFLSQLKSIGGCFYFVVIVGSYMESLPSEKRLTNYKLGNYTGRGHTCCPAVGCV